MNPGDRPQPKQTSQRLAWRYWAYLTTLGLWLLLVCSKYNPDTGLTELLGFGERWEAARAEALGENAPPYFVKPGSGGYDGQFYALIALDPTLQQTELHPAIDAPNYRARRILLPALAYALGGGKPSWVFNIYAGLNVVFGGFLAILLLHWLPPLSWVNYLKWSLILFSMGVLESVRYALTDLPALVCMLAALWLHQHSKGKAAGLTFALSIFTKETSLLHALSFCRLERINGRWRWHMSRSIMMAATLSILGFAAWLYYLHQLFPAQLNASGNLGLPFVGLIEGVWAAAQALGQGDFNDRFVFRLLAAGGLLFQLGYLVCRPQIDHPLWRMGIIFGLLFLCLGEYVWWGYWAVCRVALPMTIAFIILFDAKSKGLLLAGLLLSNLVMVHGLIRWF